MRHQARSLVPVAGLALSALILAGCGSSSDDDTATTSGGGGKKLTITSPDEGATVKQPFMLKWDSSVKLGPPESGRDHVHVYVDGDEQHYVVVGKNQHQMTDLSPGDHEVEISLQHADHSPAGAETSVNVTVSGGGGGNGSSSDDGGYKY